MRRASMILLATLLCSACTFHRQVDRASIDYNQAVANSTNDLTLLNIVRAMKRHPLHFTALARVAGSFKATGRAGLNTDIVEPGGSTKTGPLGLIEDVVSVGAEKFVPSTSAEITSGPSFDINVLDTQEFYQGILRSVDPDLVGSFINMGWPEDLVTAIFVERIELHVPSGARATAFSQALRPDPAHYHAPEAVWALRNDPDEDDPLTPDEIGGEQFGRFLKCFRLRPVTKSRPPVDLWPASELADPEIEDLAHLDGEKLTLSDAKEHDAKMIQRPQSAIKTLGLLEVKPAKPEDCSFTFNRVDRAAPDLNLSIDIYHGVAAGPKIEAASLAADKDRRSPAAGIAIELTPPGMQDSLEARDEVPARIHIVLRSAQAIIYYLGEYARASLNAGIEPYKLPDGEMVIDVRNGRSPGAFATARLGGEIYSIADEAESRTLSTISLVQQVLNLQKSAKDRPTTTSVRLID